MEKLLPIMEEIPIEVQVALVLAFPGIPILAGIGLSELTRWLDRREASKKEHGSNNRVGVDTNVE
jgi:hypothetical protein